MMRTHAWPIAGLLAIVIVFGIGTPAHAAPAPQRVKVTGEIIDSWCQISNIMGVGVGTAHHQCAIWCAVGGVPIGIQGEDGKAYILLKVEDKDDVVANPTMVDIQTDRITADADYYERDGVNYLVVTKIVSDEGIVTLNHKEFGIVPFGE
jgi:hypothetical protein